MSLVLNKEPSHILTHIEEKLNKKEEIKFKEIVQKLKKEIPLGYILKKETFYGLKLNLKEGVFIPRPETEFLVQYVLNLNLKRNCKLLDIGTGSGAIAISIKKYKKNLKIFASDISLKALFQAKNNAKINKSKINFFCGNLLEPLKEKFDLIVSNPPYIPANFMKKLPKNVKKEPKIALNGGKKGLEVIKKILNNAKNNLKNEGLLILEIGEGQAKEIKKIAKNMGYNFIETIKDFSNTERIIILKWLS